MLLFQYLQTKSSEKLQDLLQAIKDKKTDKVKDLLDKDATELIKAVDDGATSKEFVCPGLSEKPKEFTKIGRISS